MSGIIKSHDLADHALVRPFGLDVFIPQPSRIEEECNRLRQRIGVLEGELYQRDAALTHLRTEAERAIAQSRAEGHAAGVSQAQDLQAERLALLETGLLQTKAQLGEYLPSLERLAALLARESLDIILGDPEYRTDAVSKIVGLQAATIEKAALLAIELSREDFPDKKSLTDLAKRIDFPAARFVVSGELPSGGCKLTLRLGRLDVGIDQQWGVLRDMLGEMAQPDGAA